ncbi:hypothetical protein Slin15195_G062890 [Septoria linicola]|uniref:Uncharacterized protein n=1 Tax=Septoria linicola TaxID=215465 RepID=A0A9Q9AQ12_9PEZI|nr:hypothetical protein Slin15195_G062890 [Septoria linicola]
MTTNTTPARTTEQSGPQSDTKKPQTSFLDLPTELRQQIYQYTLYDDYFEEDILHLGAVPDTVKESKLCKVDSRLRGDFDSYCSDALGRDLACKYYASTFYIVPVSHLPFPLLDLGKAKNYELHVQFSSKYANTKASRADITRQLRIIRANVAAFADSIKRINYSTQTACLIWENDGWDQFRPQSTLDSVVDGTLCNRSSTVAIFGHQKYRQVAKYVLKPLGRLFGERKQKDEDAQEQEQRLFSNFYPGDMIFLEYVFRVTTHTSGQLPAPVYYDVVQEENPVMEPQRVGAGQVLDLCHLFPKKEAPPVSTIHWRDPRRG